jgi:hypothetical protein
MDLFRNPVKLDKLADGGNRHPFDHFHAAGEAGLVTVVGLSVGVIPDLAIRTLAVPTKVPIGNCV